METFSRLFGSLLVFVYHCFDRVVINGYLTGLSRPEQAVHFFREVLHVPAITKEVLRQRTTDYRNWVEAFARNHNTWIEWAEKGVRKEDHILPWLRCMERKNAYDPHETAKASMVYPCSRLATRMEGPHERLLPTP